MSDNTGLALTPGSTRSAATDEVTYSGDVAHVQLVKIVEVAGAEGSKTVVSPTALVSTANSSTVVLLLGTAFTGVAEDVSEYSHIVVSVFASHASATDGLQLQQSSDSTNWDWADAYSIPAATGKSFSAPVQGKFFRVVYTNGGVLQTAFRLVTIYSKQTKKGSSVRPQDGRGNDNDFDEALAFAMGYNGTGWDRLRATIANGLAVDVTRGAADVTASGSLAGAAQVVTLALAGQSAAAAQITGTWVGTITFEASLDGTTWTALNAVSASTSSPQTTTTVNGLYRLTPGGLQQIRANMSAFTSGSASVLLRAGAGSGGTFANQILPTKNTDGTSSQTIKAASTAAVASDQSAVVALHPSSPLPAGSSVIGKTGIDQTTPGTTNLVSLTAETTKVIGTVNQAPLTKSTQGTTGVTTQDLKDGGRVNVAMTCYQAAGIITTEALFAAATFSISRDGAAATTGQQLAVTAGKRFRLQSIVISIKNTAAAAGTSKLVLRYAAAGGAITNATPILAIIDMGSNSTTAAAYIGPTEMALPDGIELIAGSTFGFTSLCNAVTMQHTITLNGYEY